MPLSIAECPVAIRVCPIILIFFGKSVIYPFLGKDKAIDKLSNKIFAKGFPQHKHWQDVDYGISPRMLKCTDSSGELVHMGICEVEFE